MAGRHKNARSHEPTAGLDPEERIRFRNLLSELAGDRAVLLSTHIVEDIAQTSRELAILAGGRVIFRGSTSDLVDTARGSVWIMTTPGPKPEGDLTIVSTLHLGNTVQYRVLGEPRGAGRAVHRFQPGRWLRLTDARTPAPARCGGALGR